MLKNRTDVEITAIRLKDGKAKKNARCERTQC